MPSDATAVPSPAPGPAFRPVFLGTDPGTYGLARALHESYGVETTLVSRGRSGAIANSRILRSVEAGQNTGRAELLATLLAEGRAAREREPDVPLLLCCNSDSHTDLIAQHAEELGEVFAFPRMSPQTLEQIADKQQFGQLCERLGLPTPRTTVVRFGEADRPGWTPEPVDVTYPVVAKPANSAHFENLTFPGAQKVWFLQTPQEWEELVTVLVDGGVRQDFLVQEHIPGDDTHQLSIVGYVDRTGRLTAVATAQVLLGEHEPTTIGSPIAMITTPMPELMDAAERILGAVDYWGFANIDAKRDPRTGTIYYMEVNPRMGRNSFYATAAGADLAGAFVDDLVRGVEREPVRGTDEVLYSIVSPAVLPYYVRDRALRRRVLRAARRGVVHPLLYERGNWRRRAYVMANRLNHAKKLARFYPRPSTTGF
ncbi:carboxylate--amine ligase [uncultured Serinicoccus sp.]|uniref:carboxylate--amine ligase n=1 Tax=uncultured Serinicoccus sp. TaxID=735514 RepID=UPI0026073E11|nr:carboxylate--amine ligase [uncultured Serinicoccus sp.]